jgi:hypothetical protein
VSFDQFADALTETAFADDAYPTTEVLSVPQYAAQIGLEVEQLRLQQLAGGQ